MSQGSSQTHGPLRAEATEILARKRLEAELFSLDGQVRRFESIRERLLAVEQDPSLFYRGLQARREKLVTALMQSRSGSAPSKALDSLPVAHLGESLLTRPISPARLDPELGTFAFGSSGMVQVAPASEDANVLASGNFKPTGEIVPIPGSYPGDVTFNGDLAVGPEEISPDQYNPTIEYYWLRNWMYLIPFPPPSGLSRLTYRFDVNALVGLNFSGGEGQVMSFVSVGETPNLTTGTIVAVDTDAGWPLMANLRQLAPAYNGAYGYVDGQVTVQRSLLVGASHVPAVAVIVGVACGLSMMSEVFLSFPGIGNSGISISAQGMVGRVAYSYEPQLALEQ
jgi:hypothetical protein